MICFSCFFINIIITISIFNSLNYKESNSYIKIANNKKSSLVKRAKEFEIEQLRSRIAAANSEADFEELEKIIRPHQYESGYTDLYKAFILKKNEGFIEQIKSALATVKSKADCQTLKDMIEPRMDELGIRDLYMQAYNKYEELDSAEKYEHIMAKAERANSIEEFDEIIQDLKLIIRTNKDAEMQISNMVARRDKLVYNKDCKEIEVMIRRAHSKAELDNILQITVSRLPIELRTPYVNAINKLKQINEEINDLENKSTGGGVFSLFKGKENSDVKRLIAIKKQEKQDIINELKQL